MEAREWAATGAIGLGLFAVSSGVAYLVNENVKFNKLSDIQKAKRCVRRNKFGQGLNYCERVLESNPNDVAGLLGRSACLLGLRRYAECLADCLKVVEIYDANDTNAIRKPTLGQLVSIYIRIARVMQQQNKMEAAAQALDSAATLNPMPALEKAHESVREEVDGAEDSLFPRSYVNLTYDEFEKAISESQQALAEGNEDKAVSILNNTIRSVWRRSAPQIIERLRAMFPENVVDRLYQFFESDSFFDRYPGDHIGIEIRRGMDGVLSSCATREYQPGDVLFIETPLCSIVNFDQNLQNCDRCCRSINDPKFPPMTPTSPECGEPESLFPIQRVYCQECGEVAFCGHHCRKSTLHRCSDRQYSNNTEALTRRLRFLKESSNPSERIDEILTNLPRKKEGGLLTDIEVNGREVGTGLYPMLCFLDESIHYNVRIEFLGSRKIRAVAHSHISVGDVLSKKRTPPREERHGGLDIPDLFEPRTTDPASIRPTLVQRMNAAVEQKASQPTSSAASGTSSNQEQPPQESSTTKEEGQDTEKSQSNDEHEQTESAADSKQTEFVDSAAISQPEQTSTTNSPEAAAAEQTDQEPTASATENPNAETNAAEAPVEAPQSTS